MKQIHCKHVEVCYHIIIYFTQRPYHVLAAAIGASLCFIHENIFSVEAQNEH